MMLTFSGPDRFEEPRYVSALDDPEPDSWTHYVSPGEWPLQDENGLIVAYVDEAKLDCEWSYDPHARRSSIVITDIRIPSAWGKTGPRYSNLEVDGGPISKAFAASIRRYAATPQGQKALKASFDDAVEALMQEEAA